MKALLILLLSAHLAFASFTEFYCQTSGSNLNAGSTTADAAAFTYASGNWVQSTGVFTVASGNPSSDGVAVGDFASVYADGASVGVFVGRVTARDTTTITVSTTAKAGTAPTDGTGNRTLKIGGAWKGPNGAEAFPIGFVQSTLTNASSHPPRINFKNNATYDITANMSTTNAGPIFWQGYTSSPGDFGRAEIKGVTVGASHTLLTCNALNHQFSDLIFSNAAATSGTSDGVTISSGEQYFLRCVFHNIRRTGIVMNTIGAAVECEAYSCNKSNTSGEAGMSINLSGSHGVRNISHDNTAGSNANGFRVDGGMMLYRCIADSNAGNGSFSTGDVTQTQYQNEFWNNTLSGMSLANSAHMLFNLQNCNFLKNGRYAIENTATSSYNGPRYNCGFGTGTQANGLGDIEDMEGMEIAGTVTYASGVMPWTDSANGDFRINLAAAKGAGRGVFTQTSSSYTGTVGYPDLGAAQSQ